MSMRNFPSRHLAAAALLFSLGWVGCSHKTVPPPPIPEAEAPATGEALTVTLQAEPAAIESGAESKLTWTSTNAVRVELNGEAVNLNGSQSVNPTQSTDYQIVARSADGQTANAAARVTVTQPPAPAAATPPASAEIGGEFSSAVR